MKKRWKIKNHYNTSKSVEEWLRLILEQRGIKDINRFLHPTEDELIDWRKLSNIEKGLKLLHSHIEKQNNIGIIVDTDFDGIASSTIIARYLKHFTENITMLYHEQPKAHGLMDMDLDMLGEYDLVILPDGLSSEYDKYEYLHDLGTDILLLDHHPQYTPTNDAITVNCTLHKYPNPVLSGGAVTWKFCMAYDEVYGFDYAKDYIDLAASSIISDVMSVGEDSMENRYICKKGFEDRIVNPAIKHIVGNYDFNSTAVSFSIANLANAGIRSGNVELVSKIFLSDDKKEIKEMVERLKQDKKDMDEKMSVEINNIVEKQILKMDLEKSKVLVVTTELQAVAGLIANKLSSMYNRAVIVVNAEEVEENGEYFYRGSCRAFDNMNIKDIINDTGIGIAEGHQFAAGFCVKANKMQEFKDKLQDEVKDYKSKEMVVDVDLEIESKDVDWTLASALSEINKITGNNFDKIAVAVVDVKPESKFILGKRHSCVNGTNAQYLKWNDIGLVKDLDNANLFDCVAELEPNKYGKNQQVKCVVRDYLINCDLPFTL